ncbi:MAG: cyclase family protein [Acetobacteraceae bacterium]|nr:cyclase family protein [Acetobacteraceae bacterium]
MARRLIDLSTPVTTGHFRWPVERRLWKRHEEGNAGQGTWAGWNVHAFTHMDSPRHVDPAGFTTDSITLDMTVGEAAILDLSHLPENAGITAAQMQQAGAHLRAGDIAVLKTRWDERADIGTPEFWTRAPWVTDEAARWLAGTGIKAICFDFPQDHSIRFFVTGQKRVPLEEQPTHYHLLKNRGIIMFEYLRNTGALSLPRSLVVALPIRLPDSDGAPARVIAIEEG